MRERRLARGKGEVCYAKVAESERAAAARLPQHEVEWRVKVARAQVVRPNEAVGQSKPATESDEQQLRHLLDSHLEQATLQLPQPALHAAASRVVDQHGRREVGEAAGEDIGLENVEENLMLSRGKVGQ